MSDFYFLFRYSEGNHNSASFYILVLRFLTKQTNKRICEDVTQKKLACFVSFQQRQKTQSDVICCTFQTSSNSIKCDINKTIYIKI